MSSRISLLSAVVDLVYLVVLIAIGTYAGALAGHRVGVGTVLLEYGGASTLVGFGLVNRIISASMLRIVNPFGVLIVLVLATLLGYFTLPSVIIWRIWRVVAAMSSQSEAQLRRSLFTTPA